MRECAEHELCVAEPGIFRGHKGHVLAAEAGMRAPPVARSRKRQSGARMPGNELAQLASRISAGAEDPNRKFMHSECIKLLQRSVNGVLSPRRPSSAIVCHGQ
jgi:hypothetical protein